LFSRISEKEEKEEKENKENKENLEDVHTSNQMDTLACIHPFIACSEISPLAYCSIFLGNLSNSLFKHFKTMSHLFFNDLVL